MLQSLLHIAKDFREIQRLEWEFVLTRRFFTYNGILLGKKQIPKISCYTFWAFVESQAKDEVKFHFGPNFHYEFGETFVKYRQMVSLIKKLAYVLHLWCQSVQRKFIVHVMYELDHLGEEDDKENNI